MTAPKKQKSVLHRWCSFFISLGILWIIIWGLAPLPIQHFGVMTKYVGAAKQNEIHPGALYYNDILVTREAEAATREAVRYYKNLAQTASK